MIACWPKSPPLTCQRDNPAMISCRRLLDCVLLGTALYGCTAEQAQGPLTVAGTLTAPLLLPFYAFSSDCELPDAGAMALSRNEQLVAISCATWPISTVGWIDNTHLLYRLRQDYYVYAAAGTVSADKLFKDFARHQVFPCTDGRGLIYSVRKRWDQLWLAEYSLATPQADPFVRQVNTVDGIRERCRGSQTPDPHSPDSKQTARILTGTDDAGEDYRFIVVTTAGSTRSP